MAAVRRWLTGAVAAAVLPVTVAIPAMGADTGPVVLDVPADPSGDVVVTATVDPATSPYLQVKLVRGTSVSAPYEQVEAVDPAPVASTDAPTEISVPSWGLDGTDAVFALLGCGSSDPSSCTTLVASETRHIVQTAAAGATFDVPAQPVFVPEEQVRITAHNSGGGEMVARLEDLSVRAEDVLPADDSSTVFDAYPSTSGIKPLAVRRCSTLTDSRAYCEPAVATQDISFVTRVQVDPVLGSALPRLTTDPGWHASRTEVDVYSVRQAHGLSWSLYDSRGARVLGPVDAPTGTSGLDHVEINPGAEASGPLADGTYTVRFEATVTKGDLTRTGTGEHAIELVNDPPADRPAIVSAQRVWRPGAHRGPETPRFRVQAYPGSYATGTLRVRDDGGRVVATHDVTNPCLASYPRACPGDTVWDVDLDALGTVNLPAGAYSAELTMPDSYGRPMVRRLGRMDLQRRVLAQRTVTAVAARVRTGGTGDVRVYRLRVPAFRGFDRLSDLEASVHAAAPAPRGRTAVRIPALSDRWRSGQRLGPSSGWTIARSLTLPSELPDGLDLRGEAVQVRVQGDPVRARVDRVRLTGTAYVWRSSLP